MTGSRCSPAAAGPRCPGTRRSAPPSTGAGSCCRSPSARSPAGWLSSPLAPRWPQLEGVCADPAPGEGTPAAGGPATQGPAVADGPRPAEVLTALSGRVGKSILTMTEAASDDAAPRYRMLETVRAYALERLTEAGEEDAVRDALAGYYCELAYICSTRCCAPPTRCAGSTCSRPSRTT